MTAKNARKQLSILLSIALASSTTYGQSPNSESQLSLDPSTVSSSDDSLRRPKPIPAQTVSHPTKLERSILDTPRILAVPIVEQPTPREPQDTGLKLTGLGEASKDAPAAVELHQGSSQAELIRQRFGNGEPQVERWVIENAKGNIVNHGKYTEYDVSGATIVLGSYVEGQREGAWSKQVTADEAQRLVGTIDKGFSAPFTSRAKFKKGQLDGDWTISDKQGKSLIVWSYAEGVRNGTSTTFDSKGEVIQSITYKANVADGPALIADNGQAAKETTLWDGKMLRQVDKWYPAVAGKQRVLQAQAWHYVAMPVNIASSDWSTSNIEYRSTASIEPIRHGLSVTFYSNGQRESEGSYERGQRTGTFAWWYPNGQQKTVGEYRNDAENSEWTWWHENGMKHASGMFVDGRRVDEWSLWSPEGKLVKRTAAENDSQVAGRNPAGEGVKNR